MRSARAVARSSWTDANRRSSPRSAPHLARALDIALDTDVDEVLDFLLTRLGADQRP